MFKIDDLTVEKVDERGKKMKWYVGVKNGNKMEAFTSDKTPFETIYGPRYFAVIGPFKTKRAAKWAEVYGPGNPHFNHVNDAERISKLK